MLRLTLALAAAGVLAACETTAYRGATYEGGYGYSEQAIEADRYLVTFNGSSATELETVENLLLYRAAELTVEQGYDHFVIVRRDTETEIQTVRTPLYGPYSARYGFYHRYYHPRHGWYGWHDPFWNGAVREQITRHEAQAEIMMRRGPAPDNPDAYEAREVVQHLSELVNPEL